MGFYRLRRLEVARRAPRWCVASVGALAILVVGAQTWAVGIPIDWPGIYIASTLLYGALAALAVGAWSPPRDPVETPRVSLLVVSFVVGAAVLASLTESLLEAQGLFLLLAVEITGLFAGLYAVAAGRGWSRRRGGVAAVSAFTLALLLAWGGALGQRVRDLGTERLEAARAEIVRLESWAPRLHEFALAAVEVETALEKTRRLLPATLEVAELGEKIQACAAEARVRIQASYFETSRPKRPEGRGRESDLRQTATVTYFLAGDNHAIEGLVRCRERSARLVVWKDPVPTATGAELSLEVFALPDPPQRPVADLCGDMDAVWTPLIRQNLHSARQRLAELDVIRRQVNALEARKLDLKRRERTIEAIRHRREEAARLSG